MNKELKEVAVLVGLTVGLMVLLMPKGKPKTLSAPSVANDTKVNLKQNAEIALKAYTAAFDAKEPPSKLAELNRYFIANYGIRVYYLSAEQKFVAKTLDGKNILEAK